MKPKRIQRKRTKGWRMPANAVYVGRPTKWGNPAEIGKEYEGTFIDGPQTAATSYSDGVEDGCEGDVPISVEIRGAGVAG